MVEAVTTRELKLEVTLKKGFSAGILEYAFIPTAMIAIWVAYYLTQLKTRPLIATNDPHLEEILQPEHVHV